ncbi:MAG: DUF2959 domain-containing protein [Verrucomicrobiota bacterium]
MTSTRALLMLIAGLAGTMGFSGCQTSAYYSVREKLGTPKREILADRVEGARESQQEAKAQFGSALEQFLAVTKVDTGDLATGYNQLARELKLSEDRAKEVRDRIASVDSVAGALFDEWEAELSQYASASLRDQSARQLRDTRARYESLAKTMQAAADRMDPVLTLLRDQVLFLKHNLNARAVAGLGATSRELERDVSRLIADMERSIKEADAFIRSIQNGS